ncbi:hypothetical protein SS1G_13590 [Sclerotinia sclerotiorum 1980 UF-70]|uniref:N-acetyltransferase domain-containing protein n=2 Tax=Sclerotinia sclerotiorum (strain ATCC 18683 / 1980 / Ss-1) TaxID=665079 RepID=A7F7L0_SCLS1|nr:hypothetical protein SS1G_13590 [Sclerotinia sclerotiorum 1980 UF-70]APA15055.1 hypothetical protein sscle_14g098250 [Sclerotinia sclerotiorum 1980 UF-70]EDN98731.1 hypothetical protein SS1G_13590 [Sclerotinia sclerotiorum 1980 UF-70]
MTTQPKKPSPKFSKVDLIPWDPDSPSHVERLFNQRVACTWNSEYVESWREKQRQGTITLQWIVLPISCPTRDELHNLHIMHCPLESELLVDSATTFNALPRTRPSPPHSFLPIGHIALEVQSFSPPSSPTTTTPLYSTYKISGLYISSPLRGYGLGRTAMDTVETLACSPPISAQKLILEVIANEYPGKEERRIALKVEELLVEQEDWYVRRGYKIVGFRDGMWPERDEMGRVWTARCLFMEKII